MRHSRRRHRERIGHHRTAESAIRTIHAQEQVEAASANGRAQDRSPTARPRLVIAEANAAARQQLRELLGDGYELTVAQDGANALALIRESAPDLVVLGGGSPSLDGLNLLRTLRRDPATRDVPVILLAAPDGEDGCVEALEAGADDCLTLPLRGRELLARVRSLLQRARDQRDAAAALSDLRYRSLFSAMQEGLLLAELMAGGDGSVDFRYLDMNPAAERIMGVARDRFIGKTAREINPNVEEDVLRLCVEVVRTGEPQQRDLYRPVLQQYHKSIFFRPAAGQLAVLFWDVTERRKTEDALAQTADSLRRERERLEIALRTGQMGVYEWRVGESAVLWSPEVYPLYGVDPETFAPTVEAFVSLVHPDDREALRRKTQESIQRRAEFMHEYRVVRPDGDVRWIYNRSHVALDASGNAERIIGVAMDITERKRAEQRLGVLASSIDDHLVVYDRQWRYTFVNAAAARTLGKTREELLGQCIWDLFPIAVGNQYYRNLHLALEQQQVIHEEHYYEPFDKWFENHIYPSEDGVTVFSTDITARKKAEEALRRSEDALREADRRKDEFLAMLAHELRNPLAAIRNAAQIILHTEGQGESARMASGILDRQVRHMVRQVDDLLDVSRISRGRIELRKERIDLVGVVTDALEASRPPGERTDPALTVTLPEAPVLVHGDPVRLVQAIGNLLNNAFKFTGAGGQIWLTLEREGAHAVVRVRDTGVGIEAGHLERIFEMFAQVETSLDRTRGGLGLGLTLVRNLVEMHGGTVEAHSAGAGQGSEFVVRLPLA